MYLQELDAVRPHSSWGWDRAAAHTRPHWGWWHTHHKSHSKMNWTSCKNIILIVPLDVDETLEWFNSFSLVPKTNGKVQLCLDWTLLNKVLIQPVHRGLTCNDILERLAGIKYLKLIDTSSGYHNLKWDEQSFYLTTFSCPLGRYRYMWLLFGVVPAADMFQRKIGELFQGLQM